jgi:hypothetical protein
MTRIAAEWQQTLPSSSRIPELIAFACVPLTSLSAPGIGLPLNEVACLGMVTLAATRRGRGQAPRPRWFLPLLVLVPLLVAAASMANDVSATKRLAHLAVWVGLALFLSAGRIHAPSAARGMALGLLIAAGVSVAGVRSAGYAGRLTGWFGDPNTAGFYLTVCGAIAIGLTARQAPRLALLAGLTGAVVATQSRTSIMAFAIVVCWALIGSRFGPGVAAVLGVVGSLVISRLPRDLLLSAYADRTGSDLLRDRILVLEEAKVARHPWFGGGGGTATVQVKIQPTPEQ